MMSLADLSIEEGHAAEAQGPLRDAFEIFRQQQLPDDELTAHLLLARALLALGNRAEAGKEIHLASEMVAKSQNRAAHLDFSIESARVRAASGLSADLAEAARVLSGTLVEASKYGFAGHQFEDTSFPRRDRNEIRQNYPPAECGSLPSKRKLAPGAFLSSPAKLQQQESLTSSS